MSRLSHRVTLHQGFEGYDMITAIELSAIPCFRGGQEKLDSLPKVGFFYGANGSGKSSIASQIASQNPDVEIAYFSEKYIERLLLSADNIPGVFTIREASPEVQDRLAELDGTQEQIGLIDRAQTRYQSLRANFLEKNQELAERKAKLERDIWEKQKEFVQSQPRRKLLLDFVFDKKPRTMKQFHEKCETILKEDTEYRTLDEINQDFESLEHQQVSTLEKLPALPALAAFTKDELELASLRVVSASQSSLKSQFLEDAHAKWAIDGLRFLEHEPDTCPFCRQDINETLLSDLQDLLDDNYETSLAALEKMHQTSQTNTTVLEHYIEELRSHPSAELGLIGSVESLYNVWRTNTAEIVNKQGKPYETITLSDGATEAATITSALTAANNAIQAKIDLAQDRDRSLQGLVNETWALFVHESLKSDFDNYAGAVEVLQKTVNGMKNRKPILKSNWEELREERVRLLEQVTDSGPTVEQINTLLTSLGFFNFQLVPDETRDTYRLVRENGDDASSSLSEGEKTFIAFLYFYESTLQRAEAFESDKPLVCVIDDPISSLDSDTLFLIALMTRNIIDKCDYRASKNTKDSTSRLEQVFLFTHNAYFQKEVAYHIDKENRGKNADLKYYTLRKGPTPEQKHTTIAEHDRNPIVSVYAALWDEVREASQRNNEATHSTQNAMRRIIENYFRSHGGVNVDRILEGKEVTPAEYSVCRMLVSWVHDGSHNVPWDNDYSVDHYDQAIYHNAFRKLFEHSGQIQHYNFMMNIKPSD